MPYRSRRYSLTRLDRAELDRYLTDIERRLDQVEGLGGNPDFHGAWLQNARLSQLWQPYAEPREGIRYSETQEHWEQSPDGINWYPIVGMHEIDRLTSVNAVPGSQWILTHDGVDMFMTGDDGNMHFSQPGILAEAQFFFGTDPNYYSRIVHGLTGVFANPNSNARGFHVDTAAGEVFAGETTYILPGPVTVTGMASIIGDGLAVHSFLADANLEPGFGGIFGARNGATLLFTGDSQGNFYASGRMEIGDAFVTPPILHSIVLGENPAPIGGWINTGAPYDCYFATQRHWQEFVQHGYDPNPLVYGFTQKHWRFEDDVAEVLIGNPFPYLLLPPPTMGSPVYVPVMGFSTVYRTGGNQDSYNMLGVFDWAFPLSGGPFLNVIIMQDGTGQAGNSFIQANPLGPMVPGGVDTSIHDQVGSATWGQARMTIFDSRIPTTGVLVQHDPAGHGLGSYITATGGGPAPPPYDHNTLMVFGYNAPTNPTANDNYLGIQFFCEYEGVGGGCTNVIGGQFFGRGNLNASGIQNLIGGAFIASTSAVYAGAVQVGNPCRAEAGYLGSVPPTHISFYDVTDMTPYGGVVDALSGYFFNHLFFPARSLGAAPPGVVCWRNLASSPTGMDHWITSLAVGTLDYEAPHTHNFQIGGTPTAFVGDPASTILLGVGDAVTPAARWGFTATGVTNDGGPYLGAVLINAAPTGPAGNTITAWIPIWDSVWGGGAAGWIPVFT